MIRKNNSASLSGAAGRSERLEIRKITREECPAALALWAHAFEGGSADTSDWDDDMDELVEGDAPTYGIFDAGGLQAAVLINAYESVFGPDVVLKMGGIGGVACLPASRGKGYARAGIRHALERMRDAGQVVSTLYPFSFAYYRKFGWEWTGVRRKYEVPTSVLQAGPETEFVRAAAPEDRPTIKNLYAQYAKNYRGMLARSEKAWTRKLKDGKDKRAYTYLYERDGQAEGYLTHRGVKEEETHLREFVALTPRAERGLLGLLKRHEMQVKKFVWRAPENDALWLRNPTYHWDIETKIFPVVQGRVVDAAAALAELRPAGIANGAFTFALTDEHADWNAGTWRVEVEAGSVIVQRTTDAPQISLDIQAFSQAFFGVPNAQALRESDRLQVHDEAAFARFAALLSGPPVFLNDDF